MAEEAGMGGKKSRLYPAGIALFLALALIATTLLSGALAATIQLKARLNGAQEAPPNTLSSGIGAAALTLDTVTGQLGGILTFSGLTSPVTVAAIHGPAPVGVNAGVIAFLPNFPAATSGAYASFNLVPPLTPAQVHAMLFDLCYLNLHTSVSPGGEIRGQLVAPHPIPALELLLLD
jgi:hypothetical protein